MLDPLSSPKSESLHNFCHVVTRDSKRGVLRCPAQRTTKKLLRFVSHHTPPHCNVFREFLQQVLCQFTGTHSQHVVHMHTNAKVQLRVPKTRIALILCATVFFQFARQVFLPASRRCSKTQHGLAHFSTPHVFHPSDSSGSNLQVAVHTVVRLRGLQR